MESGWRRWLRRRLLCLKSEFGSSSRSRCWSRCWSSCRCRCRCNSLKTLSDLRKPLQLPLPLRLYLPLRQSASASASATYFTNALTFSTSIRHLFNISPSLILLRHNLHYGIRHYAYAGEELADVDVVAFHRALAGGEGDVLFLRKLGDLFTYRGFFFHVHRQCAAVDDELQLNAGVAVGHESDVADGHLLDGGIRAGDVENDLLGGGFLCPRGSGSQNAENSNGKEVFHTITRGLFHT